MEDQSKPNLFSWNELLAQDVEAAKQFYTQLFGWSAEEMSMGDGPPYIVFKAGDKQVGGLMAMPASIEQMGVPPYWGSYVSVDDIEATARRVEELGGRILVPPTDIAGVGRFCTFQDLQGAVLSAIQSAPTHL